MTYTTTPGTIPHAAVAHLLTLPAGTKLATAVLADAIGQPPSLLTAWLASVREHGVLLASTRRGERLLYWELGPNAPPGDPIDPDQPIGDAVHEIKAAIGEGLAQAVDASFVEAKQEVAPDRKPGPAPTSQPEQINIPPARKRPGPRRRAESLLPLDPTITLKAVAAGSYQRVALPEPAPPPAAEPDLKNGEFVCGLFSDGVLVLYQSGQRMVLERPALETLLHFLERMCEEVSP